MVLKGEVELTVGSVSRRLATGDGYYFDSRELHRFRNVADEPSEILSAVTPPTY
jgi:mannose-6-phosphate isomerase-like protein (cupin superfamily)